MQIYNIQKLILIMKMNIFNQIYINKVKWLEWFKNSCAFDSFIAIFFFSLYPFIIKNDLFVNNEYFCDNNNSSDDFKIYMRFINILIQNQNKDNFKFYFLYNDFVNQTKIDFMNFFSYEKYHFVPVVINLRKFYNNKLFFIEYEISEFCTGNCEYSSKSIKKLLTISM